jgi:uncharacterized membrane protein
MKLFEHKKHPHVPININDLHAAEQRVAGLNTRIAIALTKSVGSMETAYIFTILAIIGLFAILGLLPPVVALLVAWTSQTLIQLVLLPVIMVGQNVLGRKSELQADEQFNFTEKSYHDIEQIMKHLEAQDAELLRQSQMIRTILDRIAAKDTR